jgi:multiple sugar transport system permease protein
METEIGEGLKSYTKFQRAWRRHTSIYGLGNIAWKIARFVILVGLCFVILFPFIETAIEGFKSIRDYFDPAVRYVPKYFTWENYTTIFRQLTGTSFNFELVRGRVTGNAYILTFIYSSIVAVIQLAICALAGYGFGRYKFIGYNIVFMCVIFTLIVPPQTIMFPLFFRFRYFYFDINLIGGFWPGIILAASGLGIKNGLYIFMFRQFFKNMPKELEEAAYIDGCGHFQTFWRVMMPSAVAIMVTVFLLSFAWTWTDTAIATTYMRDFHILANRVIRVFYSGQDDVMRAMYLEVAGMIAIIPIMFVFLIGQRFFIQSVERSGITG